MIDIEKERLDAVIVFLEKLSEGYDPISNLRMPEDTVLNNRNYLRQFAIAAQALYYLSRNLDTINNSCTTNKKLIFNLTEDEIKQISISKQPISVSKMTYNINQIANTTAMKKLKATQITKWLMQQGILKKDEQQETTHKICTEKAFEFGIEAVQKVNELGNNYTVNVYNEQAQRLVIKNINTIAKC